MAPSSWLESRGESNQLIDEHYFQNFKQRHYSPHAKKYVERYTADLEGGNPGNGQSK